MRRVLFSWRGIRVWSYPACLYLGLVLGVFAHQAAARSAGLDPLRSYVAILLLIPVALSGSRLLWIALNWETYRATPREPWSLPKGGGAMLGGLPLILLAAIPLTAALGIPYWRFIDTTLFCILPTMIVGRVGCVLNGCCVGKPSAGQFAMALPDVHGVWAHRHPTQLLEGGAGIVLLALAIAVGPTRYAPGTLFLLCAAIYALARLGIQPLRADSERLAGTNALMLISAAVLVSSLIAMLALQAFA